jgi:pyruvate dehydrogenase kinase 2/3/4
VSRAYALAHAWLTLLLPGAQPSRKALLLSSQFVHNELPIRLARRVRELRELPHGLAAAPAMRRLTDHYLTSLDELVNFPPMTLPGDGPGTGRPRLLDYVLGATPTRHMFQQTDLRQLSDTLSEALADAATVADFEDGRDRFIALLLGIQARHDNGPCWPPCARTPSSAASVLLIGTGAGAASACAYVWGAHATDLVIMANGIQQVRRDLRERDQPDTLELQAWLDPFYRGRIGIRLLMGHHIGACQGCTAHVHVGVRMAPLSVDACGSHVCLHRLRVGSCPYTVRGVAVCCAALSSGSQDGHIGMVAPSYVRLYRPA